MLIFFPIQNSISVLKKKLTNKKHIKFWINLEVTFKKLLRIYIYIYLKCNEVY